MAKQRNDLLDTFCVVAAALADRQRLRALRALRNGELCVCQIIELLRLAPSTVSRHMAVLKSAGLVESRKEQRWMLFRLPDQPDALVRNALNGAFDAVADGQSAVEDARRMREILKQDREELCRRRRAG
jgi:DNA-binding transcriptional ArsR family regulator